MDIKIYVLLIAIVSSYVSVADEFLVNTTDDLVDVNPGDGVCEATSLLSDCSIRAAVIETNALLGNDTIIIPAGHYSFSIVGEDDSSMLGDLDINSSELTIAGAGMQDTIIDGNGLDRIFHINSSSVLIQDLTLQNGGDASATVLGGAILFIGGLASELNIFNIRFDNNRANAGGAVMATGSFGEPISASISNSVFENNTTVAIGVTNPFGPAIYCRFCDLQVNATTLKNNQFGGKALRIESGSLEMLNSTLSNNDGGGIRSTNADVLIKFSTFVDNDTQNLSFFSSDDTQVFEIGYSILQTTTSSNCQSGDSPVSIGYNILSDDSCAFLSTGDMQNTNASLGGLSDNGGPNPTHRPTILSAAINQIPLAECLDNQDEPLQNDQRGFLRPLDFLCDVGAIEVNTEIIFVNGFD